MGASSSQPQPVRTVTLEPTPTEQPVTCTTCSNDDDLEVITTGVQNNASQPVDQGTDVPKCFAYMHSERPLNRRELGRASWAYLHTLAAYYPVSPSPGEQQDMRQLMTLYMRTYPCGYCADMSLDEMKRNPIRCESRDDLSQWLCEMHNEVNERMGKKVFDCSQVLQRWRTRPRRPAQGE